MERRGDDPLDLASSPQWATRQDGNAREMLERAQAQFRLSAIQLRAAGMPGPARRAEQFAELAGEFAYMIRLGLYHPQAARLLRRVVRDADGHPVPAALLTGTLDFALELLRADRGNVQLADPATGTLRIAAHRGFGTNFLDYFAVVADGGSACGRAATQGAQVVIADVTSDPDFAPHRDIASASGFRAVQSTPLTDRSGRLVGMISTHYPRRVSLPRRELHIMARFGALIGTWLSPLLNAAQSAPEPQDQRDARPAASDG